MTKKQVQTFSFIVLILLITGYGVVSGAKSNYYQSKYSNQVKEVTDLRNDLKEYSSLLLEKDIKIQEKDSIIQHLSSQNEGLIWQLQIEGETNE